MVFYLLALPATVLFFLWKIYDIVSKMNEQIKEVDTKKEEKEIKRKHLAVGQSDFENAFGGRKAYAIYKNTNGLYEPVKPSNGIPIKKKEE
jgi:hypothetical protein